MCDLGVPLHEGLAADFRMRGRQFDTSAQLPEHHSEARRVRRYNLAQYAGAIRGDALAGYEDEQKSIMAGFGCLPTMHAELCECCLLMAGNETRVRWSRATHWSNRAVRQTKRSQLLLTSGRGMPVLNGDVWNHIFSFLLDGEHVKDRAQRLATWEAYDMSAAESLSTEHRHKLGVGTTFATSARHGASGSGRFGWCRERMARLEANTTGRCGGPSSQKVRQPALQEAARCRAPHLPRVSHCLLLL